MKSTTTFLLLATALMAFSCKKSKSNDPIQPATPEMPLQKAIINDVGANVIASTYNDLEVKLNVLYSACITFSASPTDPNLTVCKQAWRDARQAWEQSEAFLFGPVETNNIDPRIDTWPVNFVRIDSVLSSPVAYNIGYIDALEDGLRGFHPVEYLLFGVNGNKTAADFKGRQAEFIVALALNMKTLSQTLSAGWDKQNASSYYSTFTTAGSNQIYPTVKDVYAELLNAMISIAEEVGNGKIKEPYQASDPTLEESPFAFNSTKDFTDNIKSIENIYLGKYAGVDSKGLEDLIKASNLSMDNTIKQKITNAISALNSITIPFGQAIKSQPTQIQNTMAAINDLQAYLENSVKPYVQTLVQ